MRKMMGILVICFFSLLIAGCSGQEQAESGAEGKKDTKKEASQAEGTSVQLPSKYQNTSGNVIYDLQLEVPETLDASRVPKGIVKGLEYSDAKKALEIFGEGKNVIGTSESPQGGGYTSYSYTFESENYSSISAGGPFTTYLGDNSSYYTGVWAKSDANDWNQKEALEFSGVQACQDDLKNIMEDIGLPSDMQFDYFTMKEDRLSELEEHTDHEGSKLSEEYKADWSPEDSAYIIYGKQKFGNLPVYNHTMTIGRQMAFDTPLAHPFLSVYTARGIEYLMIGFLYDVQTAEEYLQLKPFEEIIEVVDTKLNGIIADEGYRVYRAKLYQFVQMNDRQEYDMDPAWYFEYEAAGDPSYKSVILVNAVTGEELSHW